MIYLNGKKVEFIELPNKERRLDLQEEMLNHHPELILNDVYWKYENDASIFELLLLDNAIKSYDELYNLHIGYMPYSRMDRVEKQGTAFSLKIMTDMLKHNLRAINCVFILEPHSGVTLSLLNKYGDENQWAYEFVTKFDNGQRKYELDKAVIKYTKLNIENAWFVFPDKNAAKRYNAHNYPNVIICEKVRDFATGKIQEIKAHIKKQTFTPEKNAPIIIIDDICSYGGTFVGAIKSIENDLNIISENNWLIITHAEEAMMLADVPNTFNKVFSTDSIAMPLGAISMSNQEFDEKHQFYVKPVLDIIEELK